MKNKTLCCIMLSTALFFTGCTFSESDKANAKKEIDDLVADLDKKEEQEDIDTESESLFVTEETEQEENLEDEETDTPSDTQKPSNTESSNDTQKPSNSNTASNTETETPSEPEQPKVYVVNTYSKDVTGAAEVYKYGVTRTKTTTVTYTVYSDGTETSAEGNSYYTYDASTYNATDDELRAEADSLAATYMGYYQEVLNLVNQIRAEVGVAPLTLDVTLCNAASMRALEMDYADNFLHSRPDGRECFTAMSYYGISYGAAGENIAAGYGSPAAVVEGWRNSEGHYANMINPNFTKLGVGYCNAATEYGWSHNWVQMFSD